MDCCKPKEVMPGPKEQPQEGKGKIIIAILLIVVLLGGLVLFFGGA